ncbi:MAG: hypothetical protein Q4A31_02915 [Corynebacterium sp.]|uniref:hypothetical protein n=1 Tax=Corynebacterium sp. TaxID=1720 RepID=UPI0026DCD83D|nr:hypothetical protein [Corynebacterium sp.]MDO4760858.1 hypothetical protein [Corynebacterium sp.]
MLRDIVGGFWLALRRWRYSASVACICGMVTCVMALIFSDVLTQVEVLRGGANLRKAQAVVFTVFYPPGRVYEPSGEAIAMLQHSIDSGGAYTSVVNNLAIDEPDAFGGVKTIAVVGQEAVKMFPSLGAGCQAPCVLRGASLSEEDAPVHFRGITFAHGGFFDRGAVWFDPKAAGLNLDSYQVLVFEPSQLVVFDEYEKEELISKTVLLNPTDGEIESFIRSVSQGSLYAIPSAVAQKQPERFDSVMVRAALYILALSAFSVLAVCVYGLVTREIISQEARAFFIRRLCGAPAQRLSVRILAFLSVSTLVVPLSACVVLWFVGPPVASGAKVMVGVVALAYVGFSVSAVRASRCEAGVV